MTGDKERQEARELKRNLAILAVFGIARFIGAMVGLLVVYGLLILLFRYAFGVELPNPFNLFR
jgi:hypothetical protein